MFINTFTRILKYEINIATTIKIIKNKEVIINIKQYFILSRYYL